MVLRIRSTMKRKYSSIDLITNRNNLGLEKTIRDRLQSAPQYIHRLGLEAELVSHTGCVNCLDWSENGQLLASGSDDNQIKIWDPFRHKLVTDILTPHQGNIFSVKFLPKSNNGTVVSGSADAKIFMFDLNKGVSPTWSCRCHCSRVKRLATAPEVPYIFWSASEDGDVFEFDVREPHVCKSGKVSLICLNNHVTYAQAKCIAVNPRRPELIAIGSNDCYARVYDRRMIRLDSLSNRVSDEIMTVDPGSVDLIPRGCATYFTPGHLRKYPENSCKAITYLTFSPDGKELLVNMGAEQIYLYDVNNSKEPNWLHLPAASTLRSSSAAAAASVERGRKESRHQEGTAGDRHKYGSGRGEGGSSGTGSRHYSSSRRSSSSGGGTSKRRKDSATSDFFDFDLTSIESHRTSRAWITKLTRQIHATPNDPELLFRRASQFLMRGYYGDSYAALKDFHASLHLDPRNVIGYYRLAQCLFKLHYFTEAFECLQELKTRFPTYIDHIDINNFEKRINDHFKKGHKHDYSEFPPLTENESYWRMTARDYKERFLGHCNTTTDIKEANFFGNDSNYIIAGSDDGNFYIWERSTNLITEVYKGDVNIVNCVQPHPTTCLLATSGIDSTVKIWSPQPENYVIKHRIEFSEKTVKRNQYRMFESRRMH